MKIEEVAGETVSTEAQSAIATAVANLENTIIVTLNSVYNGTIFATEEVEISANADLGNLSSIFSPASRYGLTCTGVTTEVTSNPIPAGSVFTATYVDNASETAPLAKACTGTPSSSVKKQDSYHQIMVPAPTILIQSS